MLEKDYYDQQTGSAKPIEYTGIFVAIIMAVGSSFAAMNTMYAAVARRAREIGTLRVLGFSKGSILTSFLAGIGVLSGARRAARMPAGAAAQRSHHFHRQLQLLRNGFRLSRDAEIMLDRRALRGGAGQRGRPVPRPHGYGRDEMSGKFVKPVARFVRNGGRFSPRCGRSDGCGTEEALQIDRKSTVASGRPAFEVGHRLDRRRACSCCWRWARGSWWRQAQRGAAGGVQRATAISAAGRAQRRGAQRHGLHRGGARDRTGRQSSGQGEVDRRGQGRPREGRPGAGPPGGRRVSGHVCSRRAGS
jgi:hypothetical protein